MFNGRKVRVIISLILVVVFSLAFSACGNTKEPPKGQTSEQAGDSAASDNKDDSAADKTFSVGVAMADFKIPFFVRMMAGMEQSAKENGIELDIQDGKSDPATQINQIETFITQKKDAIIVVASQLDALVPAAKQANEAGIPIITVNRQLGEGAEIVTYVGCNDEIGGQVQGELVNDLLGEEGKIVLIQGSLGSSPQVMRQKGLKSYLGENAPGIEIIAAQNADWDRDKAITAAQNFLTRYPKGEIDAIVVQGPYMPLGVVQALKVAERDELLGKIVAFDLPQEVVDAITEGEIYGTVLQDPQEQGRLGLEVTAKYLNGERDNIEKETWTDLPKVYTDNIQDFKAAW